MSQLSPATASRLFTAPSRPVRSTRRAVAPLVMVSRIIVWERLLPPGPFRHAACWACSAPALRRRGSHGNWSCHRLKALHRSITSRAKHETRCRSAGDGEPDHCQGEAAAPGPFRHAACRACSAPALRRRGSYGNWFCHRLKALHRSITSRAKHETRCRSAGDGEPDHCLGEAAAPRPFRHAACRACSAPALRRRCGYGN